MKAQVSGGLKPQSGQPSRVALLGTPWPLALLPVQVPFTPRSESENSSVTWTKTGRVLLTTVDRWPNCGERYRVVLQNLFLGNTLSPYHYSDYMGSIVYGIEKQREEWLPSGSNALFPW